jgi:hypothetical protein
MFLFFEYSFAFCAEEYKILKKKSNVVVVVLGLFNNYEFLKNTLLFFCTC